MSQADAGAQPRVLIVRVGAMGDVLHALPAVAALRRDLPDASIEWVVDARWAPLLMDSTGNGPVVSRMHLAETRLWSGQPFSGETRRSVLRLRRALREQNFDAVVDMQGTLRSAVIGRFASDRVMGYADPRESLAKLLYRQRLPRRGRHVVEQGAALLGTALGLPLAPLPPPLPLDQAADRWAEAYLGSILSSGQRVAVLAPTAGWLAKQWPAAHFAELARTLHQQGWAVLVNAATANDPLCAALVEASAGAALPLRCDLAQLIAVLRRSGVVIGGDSGPVHLAAALGTPTVALFGPTDPARNGPWGSGRVAVLRHPASQTSYRHTARSDPGLAAISTGEVMAALHTVV